MDIGRRRDLDAGDKRSPWPALDRPHVIVFDNALYLVGGESRADVWRSTDGKNWTELTAEAPWKARHGYEPIVFDGKMWVYGGYGFSSSKDVFNDIWYSSDERRGWSKPSTRRGARGTP